MTEAAPSSPPLRVLIVDDEAPARRRLRDLLADVSAELPNTACGEAADGEAALAMAAEQTVDVVLVDIRMPRMDGIEFARHLAHPGLLKPFLGGGVEPDLAVVLCHAVGKTVSKSLAENPLGHTVVQLQIIRQPERMFHDPVVNERRPDFHRVCHR